jgi:cyclophilin family peptidyl-prolyl cis-trans isomerase
MTMQWSSPPGMTIDTDKEYRATIKTDKGKIDLDLFPEYAPKTVNNFVFLANQGFYDDVLFHRVISNFMIQGGDPTGTGRGGPGYRFEDEVSDNPLIHEESRQCHPPGRSHYWSNDRRIVAATASYAKVTTGRRGLVSRDRFFVSRRRRSG